ncbi:MAG: arabinogalactan endo-1,4-beta-galactosidase [Clostridiales bacterium]|nr:arabinogalactan endo-1,4-beta-galactosidase [Clostridiales bacterium]
MTDKFAYGVDLGWVSQLEQMGYRWVDESGEQVDPIRACKGMGANAVRLRIFVSPEEDFWQKNENERCMLGFCDMYRVLEVAERVKALGMDLMLDFHYSDHFADPQIQDIPKAWKDDDDQKLTERVYDHTREALLLFRENDIEPKWVQVGNEINFGMMWPKGSLETAPKQLVRFLNAGYEAVKEIFPDCLVITHMAAVNNEAWCVPFLDNFFANSGKTDIIGFSYYPYWAQMQIDEKEMGVEEAARAREECWSKAALAGWLSMYEKKYDRPVMIVEIGGEDEEEEDSCQLLLRSAEAVREVPDGRGLGIFYWEPDATRSVLPDAYPLGAARQVGEHELQYTKTLTAYKTCSSE